jgi:hypothetical protein
MKEMAMLPAPVCRPLALVVLLLGPAAAPAADGVLSRVELAKLGKAATALVEMKEPWAYGTAFCIHPSGLFLTNEHVVHEAGPGGAVGLILNPGLAKQKVLRAEVVRTNPEEDVALLRADDGKDLPALELGSDDSLVELMDVVAFGFPFGTALPHDPKDYPAISINTGHVTALRRREGRLNRIQIDAALNPGNSGGPVLDEHGKVVGIVVTGVRGSGINFAIPVDVARRFVFRPEIHLILPFVTKENRDKPAVFKARVTSLVPFPKPPDLELILTAGDGKDRTFPMERVGESYRAEAVPVLPRTGPAAVEEATIACAVVARQDGKELGRAGDSLAIAGVFHPEPEGPAAGTIAPPVLEGGKAVRAMPSTIRDVAVGGGGRFLLLNLAKVRKVAVFDVRAARVVKYIPVAEDDVKVAAGRDKLVVVLPDHSVVERWSLATFEREMAVPLAARQKVTAVALGSASQGPVLVGTAGRISFLDLRTLRPLDVRAPVDEPGGIDERTRVRASADGRTFGLWRADSYPQGLRTVVLIGRQLQVHVERGSAGHLTPGPDGNTIFTGRGLYTVQLKPLREDNDAGAAYCVPATHGTLYLSVNPRDGSLAVHMVGHLGPLARLTDVEVPDLGDGDRESFPGDRRLNLIPDAKVIVTIPISNDRLVVQRFDLLEALKKADVDYLLVTSQPEMVAKTGEAWTYQLAVLSRKGGVTYRVESGPKGMEVSPQGLVKWQVPARTEETEAAVIIAVTDKAGQEVYQTFTLSLRE